MNHAANSRSTLGSNSAVSARSAIGVRRVGLTLTGVVASLALGCGTVLGGAGGARLGANTLAQSGLAYDGSSLAWSKGGLVALARPLPSKSDSTSGPMLGFMPTAKRSTSESRPFVDGKWIKISTSSGNVSLMNGNDEIAGGKANIAHSLKSGTYRIVHRQEQPLWYAPDTYFSTRKLAVPPAGAKSRYLRGALGEFAVYLDSEVAIHNAAIWCDEVGGVKVETALAESILKNAQPGSLVVVE